MILLTEPVRLYGKYVVSDAATSQALRSLSTAYHPYIGMRSSVNKYWRGGTSSTEADIEMLFNNQPDFDADMKQPQSQEDEDEEMSIERMREEDEEKVEKYNPRIHNYPYDGYYRRLEDIDIFYVRSYICNLVQSIMIHDTGGIKDYLARNTEQTNLYNSTDDGESIEEIVNLVLDEDPTEWSPEARQEARDKLPYVIKRLHTLSRYTTIHMLSFISAFLKARTKNQQSREGGSTKKLKVNAVIEEGVYKCDSSGNISKRLDVKNRNEHAAEMFDWIMGYSEKFTAYIQDYKDYVHYCEVLNVDIMTDDMSKYTTQFVNSLTVSIVTPNSQYNKQVFNVLCNRGITVPKEKRSVDIYGNTVELFREFTQSDPWLSSVVQRWNTLPTSRATSMLNEFMFRYHTTRLGQSSLNIDLFKVSFDDVFAQYQGRYLLFQPSLLGTNLFDYDICLLSSTGQLVVLSDCDLIYVMNIAGALENIMNYVNGTKMENVWRRIVT